MGEGTEQRIALDRRKLILPVAKDVCLTTLTATVAGLFIAFAIIS